VLRVAAHDLGQGSLASIIRRELKSGGTSYRVVWREGGTRAGAQQSETFGDEIAAGRFKLDVEEQGEHWPPGWVKGVGYVQVEPPPPEPTPFMAFAQRFVREELTQPTSGEKHRYLQQLGDR